METLSAHSRPDDIRVSNPVRQHLEMQQQQPTTSLNPATRITAHNKAASLDGQSQSQSQSQNQILESSCSQEALSSDVSAGTESTQKTSPEPSQDQNQDRDASSQFNGRLPTPDEQARSKEDAVVSPARHKRTASGLLKAVDTPNVPSRADSVSSSTSKVGETSPGPSVLPKGGADTPIQAAAQLKTRLAYAMAKVQHGWEHRNINEVEQLAAALPQRNAASPPAISASINARSPPTKRRSGSGVVSWSLSNPEQGLEPPIEVPSSQDNSLPKRSSLSSTSSSHGPSTPKPRPPPLRSATQTQQAEQDAMDALMLMGGSPGNGGKFPPSQVSSSSQQPQQSQSQTNQQSRASSALLSPRTSEPAAGAGPNTQRLGSIGRSQSSTSEGSVAASEAREARERILDEAEDDA